MAFYDIDAYTIKIVDQSILMIVFGLTFLTVLLHVFLRLRYRYSWHRISVSVKSNFEFFSTMFFVFSSVVCVLFMLVHYSAYRSLLQ